MTTPYQTATLVMDNVPLLMRLLRKKFHEKRIGDLSMAQFRTLAFVSAQEGASLSEAAGHLGLGLPSMSKLVEALVRRKLMVREVHGRDRRRICLSLTAEGKRELEEAYRHTQSFFTEQFAQLTEAERSQIAGAFGVMQRLFSLNPGAALIQSAEAGQGSALQ